MRSAEILALASGEQKTIDSGLVDDLDREYQLAWEEIGQAPAADVHDLASRYVVERRADARVFSAVLARANAATRLQIQRAVRLGEQALAIVAFFAIALAAVSHTAFRVDEPNILAMARQIAAHPLDPYGFTINWTGTNQPAFRVLANPPLLPAWLAVVGRATGWREVPLHIAVIPFAVIFLLSLVSLTRRFAPGCESVAALAQRSRSSGTIQNRP